MRVIYKKEEGGSKVVKNEKDSCSPSENGWLILRQKFFFLLAEVGKEGGTK